MTDAGDVPAVFADDGAYVFTAGASSRPIAPCSAPAGSDSSSTGRPRSPTATQVTRFSLPACSISRAAADPARAWRKAACSSFDAAKRTLRTYDLPGATAATLGELDLVLETPVDSIHGLVASGEHVWFADGAELGVVDGTRVAETNGARIAADAKLRASTSGDVWVLAGGALSRFTRVDPESDLDLAWKGKLSGVFARACAGCHLPDGPAGVDLSNAEQTMPPQGRTLTDADRDAIRTWAEGK